MDLLVEGSHKGKVSTRVCRVAVIAAAGLAFIPQTLNLKP